MEMLACCAVNSRGEHSSVGAREFLDFIIVGAQKAASTLLVDALGQHPEIWMPDIETHFFRDPYYREAALPELSSLLKPTSAGQRIGIKCPNYLGSPEVPPRIVRHVPHASIVVSLRDPVRRAVSAYYWYMLWGVIPNLPLGQGLAAILDGKVDGTHPCAREVLEYGLYGKHLTHWERFLPRKQFVIVTDAELKRDLKETLNSIVARIGASARDVVPDPTTRSNEGIYSLSRIRFLQRRNRFVFTWNTGRQVPEMRRPTRGYPAAFNAAVVGIDRLILQRTCADDSLMLAPDLVERLRAFYREDLQLLRTNFGVPVEDWPLR